MISSVMPRRGLLLVAGSVSSSNLAANTTYYFGYPGSAINTTAGAHRIYMPTAGVIRRIYGHIQAANNPTTEAHTLSIRVNNTTDYTVSASFAWPGGAASAPFSSSSLAIPVAAGDYVEIKLVTNASAWVTAATTPTAQATIYIA